MIINVVNKYKHVPNGYPDVYIGRGSVFGNPFTSKPLAYTKAIFQCDSREQSIELHRNYLKDQFKIKGSKVNTAIKSLYSKCIEHGGINLVCFCDPKPCHGDNIKDLLNILLHGAMLGKCDIQ